MPYRALAIDMMDGFRAAAAPDAKLRTLFGNVGDDFATGALLAVNLGNDADTVGAVYGQLAGAYFGFTGIPTEWTSQVHDVDMIINTATALHDLVPEMRVSDESAVHLHECLL